MKFTPMKMTPEDRKAFSELIGCVIGVGGSLVAAGIAAGVIAAGVSPDTVGIAIVAIFGAAFVIGIVWLFIIMLGGKDAEALAEEIIAQI